MEWSRQQLEALAAICAWLERGSPQTFYLAGYAGTGKTTLAREIGRVFDCQVVYAAFTGKAAARLREQGCAGATTIDSLIYHPKIRYACARQKLDDNRKPVPDPCAEPHTCRATKTKQRCQYLRQHFAGRNLRPAIVDALIIIDEVSMVNEKMGNDLLSFKKRVVTLGDVAQLPPVDGLGFFTRDVEPDFQLTEIHRQALGSPVIQLATLVREHKRLLSGNYNGEHGASWVVDGFHVVRDDLRKYDQIIVGTHRMRHAINHIMRKQLGYAGEVPQVGEKLVCLKNRSKEKGLLNGTLWEVIQSNKPADDGFVNLVVKGDELDEPLYVEAPMIGFSPLYEGSGNELPGDPFAFGYAITCHKAQGSQWKSVLVIDESHAFQHHRHRWLYTAITRAEERVTVVR